MKINKGCHGNDINVLPLPSYKISLLQICLVIARLLVLNVTKCLEFQDAKIITMLIRLTDMIVGLRLKGRYTGLLEK